MVYDPNLYGALEYRLVGPYRGGRVTAVTGVPSRPFTFYMGTSGGGVWKSENAGTSWKNISDGDFGSASIGAVAVAPSDPNVIYVGTGSGCPRGNIMNGDTWLVRDLYLAPKDGKGWFAADYPNYPGDFNYPWTGLKRDKELEQVIYGDMAVKEVIGGTNLPPK